MSSDNKAERYTFAAVLLIIAAIVILSFNSLPFNENTEITGVAVSKVTTTMATEEDSEKTSIESMININTATVAELDTLEGIGVEKANDIIAYRKKLGGYTTIEQLMEISGIGEATFNKIKNNITV